MEKLHPTFSVRALAEALAVSKSGFHAHRQKPQRPRRQRDAARAPLIAASFAQSRQTYGCRRVRADLRAQGQRVGKARLARLMRAQKLRPRQKRRFRPQTTDSAHPHPPAENWLARVPAPARPGQVWQSDFTYVATAEGWLYVAFTLDACSRRCLAHHCREDLSAALVTTPFTLALERQRPPPGLLHHSDRGVQYAGAAFATLAAAHGVTRSMSRPANPYDNALAESFVATLKTECFAGAIPASRTAARLALFDYIETFYNPRRRHSALAYQSPLQFEKSFPLVPPEQLHPSSSTTP